MVDNSEPSNDFHGDGASIGRGMMAPETSPGPGMAPYSLYSKEDLAKMIFDLEKRVKILERDYDRKKSGGIHPDIPGPR